MVNLDKVRSTGKIFVKMYRRTCLRACCQKCYEYWASKEAKKATRRIEAYKSRLKPIHVVVSVSSKDRYLEYRSMKQQVRKLLKQAGIVGGLMVFHPFRQDHLNQTWYYSPHFHIIALGWIKDTDKIYNNTGYLIKNLGIRDNLRATIFYQLSHAGFNEKLHTVTYFGEISYNRLHIATECKPRELCPLCSCELEALRMVEKDDRPPPNFSGDLNFFEPDQFVRQYYC